MTIEDVMAASPVIPVLVIDEVATAEPLARALVAGGLRVLEVTLRTPAAFDGMREMAKVEGAIVGAGTVLAPAQLDEAVSAGARFIVSPGLTDGLARAAIASDVPFLPGIATASDIMRGLDLGLARFKFFPAAASGGLAALSALAGPFPQCRFCPTGGIGPDDAQDWLAHPAVDCVGGSWLAPRGTSDFSAVEQRAREAARLRR
jgi:2-dehydro-3-deoxyphosphogluconate aldolase/(4S)-4-hydroxy-2-oxoglutarate aldolase